MADLHHTHEGETTMHILWTIIIGFVAGIIATFLYPGKNYEPSGFIMTTILGIIGFCSNVSGPGSRMVSS